MLIALFSYGLFLFLPHRQLDPLDGALTQKQHTACIPAPLGSETQNSLEQMDENSQGGDTFGYLQFLVHGLG